jgi:hypothetical protein
LETQNHPEADALIDLARSLRVARPDVEATAREVEELVQAALSRDAPIDVERGFEQAARRLRAGWLRSVAAETARVLRSPTEREFERLAHSRHDAYGYERDFQPESLEQRCKGLFGDAPSGWTVAHVMFSSGQAALATILVHLSSQRPGKLRVAHVGSYFETSELVRRACAPAERRADADCIIVEPMACNGRFTNHDLASIGRSLSSGQTAVVDETLLAPMTRSPAIMSEATGGGAAVMRLVSGLKLLQQGLEIANVGIVSIFAKEQELVASLADGLKRCRTLTGTGLRFVDALALEAPFFLDREPTQQYADRVFAHNAALARNVAARNRFFKPLGGAELAAAPYCAFELESGNTVQALEAFAERFESEAKARRLLIERGGSFGFRGHRYEVIEPETGEPPFLRVALGARDDHSCRGIIGLMAELAEAAPGTSA